MVRGFWAAVAADYQPPLSAEMVAAAIARAEGNVLHALMLHDTLSNLSVVEERDADRVPRGLQELIGDVWDRAAAHEAVRAGLGALCAAQEALSLDAIAELAGWSYDDRQHFVRGARQLLLEEPASWATSEPGRAWPSLAHAARHRAVLLRELARTRSWTIRAQLPVDIPIRQTWITREARDLAQRALSHANFLGAGPQYDRRHGICTEPTDFLRIFCAPKNNVGPCS